MEGKENRIVGIDLAKRSMVVHIIDPVKPKAEVVHYKTESHGLNLLVKKLRPDDLVGLEVCAFGAWLARFLEKKVGCKVIALNPGDIAIIYRSTKKTDLEDAAKIAWLLQRLPEEELPKVDLPSEQEERRRSLVSEHRSKKKIRTALINRLHSLFVREGITTLTKKDLSRPESREKNTLELNGLSRKECTRIMEELKLVEAHIEEIQAEIEEDLAGDPKVKYIMSMPGVGPTMAAAFLGHVGDGSRFSGGRQVSHFVGMTPRIDSSGETTRMGHIHKRGCIAIRSIIVQSAWAAVHSKKDNQFKRKYVELSERRGKGRAIVAVARRMLEVMWVLVSREVYFQDYNERDLKDKMSRLKTDGRKLGSVA